MKICVITVVKDDKHSLIKTLKSLACVGDHIERLIIKDASSMKLLENDSCKRISNVKDVVYLHGPDKGPYHAMNIALKYIKGNYVWFLNAGDVLLSKEAFLKAREVLKDNPIMAAFNWYLDGKIVLKHISASAFVKRLKYTWANRHQSMFFRSDFFKEKNIFYDTRYRICADRKLMIEILSIVNFNESYIKVKNIFLTNNDRSGISHKDIFRKEKENILISLEYRNFCNVSLTIIKSLVRMMSYMLKFKGVFLGCLAK